MTPTTQEGLPALATNAEVAKLQVLCDLKGEMAVAAVRLPMMLARIDAALGGQHG